MMCLQTSNNFIPREEQLYHSIPIVVESRNNKDEIDGELYCLLMENLAINDPYDLLFDQYVAGPDLVHQPFGHREKEMKDRANLLHKRIPHSRTTYMEDVEILEIATNAAKNSYLRTRTMKQMPIDGASFTSAEVEDIASWYLFE